MPRHPGCVCGPNALQLPVFVALPLLHTGAAALWWRGDAARVRLLISVVNACVIVRGLLLAPVFLPAHGCGVQCGKLLAG